MHLCLLQDMQFRRGCVVASNSRHHQVFCQALLRVPLVSASHHLWSTDVQLAGSVVCLLWAKQC